MSQGQVQRWVLCSSGGPENKELLCSQGMVERSEGFKVEGTIGIGLDGCTGACQIDQIDKEQKGILV